MCCGVPFYRSRHEQVLYQGSIHAVLIMSVMWKKTEFYKREKDREVIVNAARGLGEDGFPIIGPFPLTKFFLLSMKLLVFPIVT